MQIGDIDVIISGKKQWRNLAKMQSQTIMSLKTKQALDAGKTADHAETLDYKDVKKFVNKHKKKLFSGAKDYQINVLTSFGWRSVKRFKENPNWVSLEAEYGDKYGEIEDIIAIEILYWA